MNEQIWQTVRYLLIAGGSFLAGLGKVPATEVGPLADMVIQVGSGLVALASALWGLYVKAGTVAVPEPVAVRMDMPTVSSATGQVTPAAKPS